MYKGVISSRLKMANSSISVNFLSSLHLYHLVLLSFFLLKIYSEKTNIGIFLKRFTTFWTALFKTTTYGYYKNISSSILKWKLSIHKFYLITLLNCFQHQITFSLCNLYLSLMSEENPITVNLFYALTC